MEKYHHKGWADKAFQSYVSNCIETLWEENSCQNFLPIKSMEKALSKISFLEHNLKDDIHNNLFINSYQMDDTNWML